jgi:hypothetical protein
MFRAKRHFLAGDRAYARGADCSDLPPERAKFLLRQGAIEALPGPGPAAPPVESASAPPAGERADLAPAKKAPPRKK